LLELPHLLRREEEKSYGSDISRHFPLVYRLKHARDNRRFRNTEEEKYRKFALNFEFLNP
jgi:hypothetical protein